MTDSPIRLQFAQAFPADPDKGKVAAEHYAIVEKSSQQKAGAIRLRLSNEENILLYAGHIGYNVDESYRGHHYAAYACLALKSIALQHGFTELWITCDPDNQASRRTCERIGATLIEIIDLPEDLDMYQDGERQKCRYWWKLE
ncbi:GNAT family N-acetyltransferase [Spirosoma validum]|uniref:GNAT family N-acetyltransferase n=1 Tax=Spirosoma validum TaxID=2771355 RepID=A0A927B5V8_9BACT|nr:GNAT family N-acetyltransferase [Spirosoma validum]MBD2756015.1 GNAT family N-acetyltransferase [Spirosoma validum]